MVIAMICRPVCWPLGPMVGGGDCSVAMVLFFRGDSLLLRGYASQG